ncbi:hypothetical protein NZD88_20635 [Chryseobacterium antibioticum]|uniref:Lipoprotein n=1 Tax=Chryseobacterium pyrolae TaxID=2987481 RepID=A0ABT2IMS7_9FLAO|nr:hypothetical protein [Chryseobacterium pyrolae]MCT2409969.1 hypothetical protein [Chryseobacterium pyrolae]
MNLKLFLSGILLSTILAGCADRNEDVSKPVDLSQKSSDSNIKKIESAKVVIDSLGIPENLIENNKENESIEPTETIDPTKPDRPK